MARSAGESAGRSRAGARVELIKGCLMPEQQVEVSVPVGDELLQLIEMGACIPALALHLIGPAWGFSGSSKSLALPGRH